MPTFVAIPTGALTRAARAELSPCATRVILRFDLPPPQRCTRYLTRDRQGIEQWKAQRPRVSDEAFEAAKDELRSRRLL